MALREHDMAAYEYRNTVMFQHCDPAGIVFYPRYFEMINAVVETFFADALGWSFAQMHGGERFGVPTRRIATDFLAPSRLGDTLDWTLTVTRTGRASLDVAIRADCGDETRLEADATLVLVDLQRMASIPWPDARRATLKGFVAQ